MVEEPRPRLGRGLAALLGAGDSNAGPGESFAATHRPQRVPVEQCRPSPRNPRKAFDEEELADLAGSIRARGVLQPIVVRAIAGRDGYEIIAGERRWRAAQRAGVHSMPVVVVEADDKLALELAIVENVQRADLNPAEEARGYRSLMSEHNYNQADLGAAIGKSRSHVANTLRLLKLPATVLDMVASGEISAGHARALLMLPQPERVAREIVRKGLSVRAVEAMVAKSAQRATSFQGAPKPDADSKALAADLSRRTGLKITIERDGDAGRIVVAYRTLEQCEHVLARLNDL